MNEIILAADAAVNRAKMCDGVRVQGGEFETSIAPQKLSQAVWPEHGRER